MISARSAEVMPYIHELPEWPAFRWDYKMLAEPLASVRHRQAECFDELQAIELVLDAVRQADSIG